MGTNNGKHIMIHVRVPDYVADKKRMLGVKWDSVVIAGIKSIAEQAVKDNEDRTARLRAILDGTEVEL